MTLNKKDPQKFLKRLRKINKEKIKYYSAGEYGGQTMRPHYHMIIFNAEIQNIEDTWRLGTIHYGTVQPGSIQYVLKYLCKDKKIPLHKNDDRVPEFSHMSKGLGLNYLTPQIRKYHQNLQNNFLTVPDGYKVAMPRYYKEKLFTEIQKNIIAEEAAEKHAQQKRKTDEQNAKDYGDTYDKIKRERVLHDLSTYHKKNQQSRNKI